MSSARAETPTQLRIWLQFLGAALAWGSSFLFIKIALDHLGPLMIVAARVLLGAATLVLLNLALRTPWPSVAAWLRIAPLGIIWCVVPFTLISWAEQGIASGVASLYNASTPLFTFVLAVAFIPAEHLSRQRALGMMVGFLGVLTILAPWQLVGTAHDDDPGSPLHHLAMLGAALSYAFGFIYVRTRIAALGLPAVSVAMVQVVCAAVAIVPLALLIEPLPTAPLPWEAAAGLLVMGVFSTGVAYLWNTNVIQAWGPTRASSVTYLMPVVGILLGVSVLGERIHWNEPAGALVVLAGVWLLQRRADRAAAVELRA